MSTTATLPPPATAIRSRFALPPPAADITREIVAKLAPARREMAEFERELRPRFDALPPFQACPEHPEQQLPRDWEATLWESWQASREMRPVYAGCPECGRRETEARRHRVWARRGLPSTLFDANLDTFSMTGEGSAEAVKTCWGFARRRRGFLIVLGDPGLGKTHLACGVLRAIGDGLFTTHPDLLTDLRATYKTGGTDKFLDGMKSAPCLVIDDFGVSSGGADEAPTLYQILATRHGEGLPTVITSNEELATVREVLGYRLCDRMAEDYRVVTLRGQSWRRRYGSN